LRVLSCSADRADHDAAAGCHRRRIDIIGIVVLVLTVPLVIEWLEAVPLWLLMYGKRPSFKQMIKIMRQPEPGCVNGSFAHPHGGPDRYVSSPASRRSSFPASLRSSRPAG
jgi:hypothetical protein